MTGASLRIGTWRVLPAGDLWAVKDCADEAIPVQLMRDDGTPATFSSALVAARWAIHEWTKRQNGGK